MYNDVQEGNVGWAIVDAIGIAADVVCIALPVVPGGLGIAIKAYRAGDIGADALRATRAGQVALGAHRASQVIQAADTAANAWQAYDSYQRGDYLGMVVSGTHVGVRGVQTGLNARSWLASRSLSLTAPGRVSAPRTAESLVTWVDEGGDLRLGGNPGMSRAAYDFQSGTPGARSSLVTGRSQAPYLEFTNEAGQTIGAKFDGVQGLELVDRKLNPFFSAKAVDEAARQAAVSRHYGLQAVWELPTPSAVNAANRFMQSNSISGITVRLGQ